MDRFKDVRAFEKSTKPGCFMIPFCDSNIIGGLILKIFWHNNNLYHMCIVLLIYTLKFTL